MNKKKCPLCEYDELSISFEVRCGNCHMLCSIETYNHLVAIQIMYEGKTK